MEYSRNPCGCSVVPASGCQQSSILGLVTTEFTIPVVDRDQPLTCNPQVGTLPLHRKDFVFNRWRT
jgi:hypothetical protein